MILLGVLGSCWFKPKPLDGVSVVGSSPTAHQKPHFRIPDAHFFFYTFSCRMYVQRC